MQAPLQRLRKISAWEELGKEAIIEEPLPNSVVSAEGTIIRTKLHSRGAEYFVSVNDDGFLVLAYPWSTGWQADLDSSPIKLFRVNHGLIGIMLPAGQHTLELHYRPPLLVLGKVLSLLGCTALLLLLILLPTIKSTEREGNASFFSRKSSPDHSLSDGGREA